VLAHGSGIDDLAMVAAAVGLYLAVSVLSRRRDRGRAPSASGTCPYCDDGFAAGVVRCPACGFRVPRAERAAG
jgi:hypothetical protein